MIHKVMRHLFKSPSKSTKKVEFLCIDPAVAQRWYVLLNQHNAQIVHDATQRQSLGFDHSGDTYYPGHDDSKVTGGQ